MSFLTNGILVTAVLSAIVTGLALAGVFLLFQGDDNAPIQVILPTPEVEETPSVGSRNVTVHISGAVANPGVYLLSAEQRLADAVADAGGATEDADLDAVNLAQWLRDGQQYHIPEAGEITSIRADDADGLALVAAADTGCGGLMDLNTASASQLDSLPGIGPVRANDIVARRDQTGPFTSVEQVTDISGIGPATFEKIRDLVAVCN